MDRCGILKHTEHGKGCVRERGRESEIERVRGMR